MAEELSDKAGDSNTVSSIFSEKKYHGKYVAVQPFRDHTVVAYGRRLIQVSRKAHKQGCQEPMILFVPKPCQHYVYSVA